MTAPTINLVGPSTSPGAPAITPEAINIAVNNALAALYAMIGSSGGGGTVGTVGTDEAGNTVKDEAGNTGYTTT